MRRVCPLHFNRNEHFLICPAIIMPDDVAEEKVKALHALGAEVERVRPASIVDKKQVRLAPLLFCFCTPFRLLFPFPQRLSICWAKYIEWIDWRLILASSLWYVSSSSGRNKGVLSPYHSFVYHDPLEPCQNPRYSVWGTRQHWAEQFRAREPFKVRHPGFGIGERTHTPSSAPQFTWPRITKPYNAGIYHCEECQLRTGWMEERWRVSEQT